MQVAGNYAADLLPNMLGKKKGFPIGKPKIRPLAVVHHQIRTKNAHITTFHHVLNPSGLYLDAKTNSFVEEFSTSNFVGISKDGAFVSPNSPTVLPSITKKVSLI